MPSSAAESRKPRGFALITVTIFVLIGVVMLLALFDMASYETRGARYRQNSTEAFYLADGAVERARAKFLEDRTWRNGWTDVAAGRGRYDLTVRDTTFQSETDVVQLVSTGAVENATRRIEVMAKIDVAAFDLPLLVMGDAEVAGNLCLNGDAHVNGDAGGNNGQGDPHFTCGCGYTECFVITPPPIYTDADHFPDATYYTVKGDLVGGVPAARIFDRAGNEITGANNMQDVLSYNPGSQTFIYDFTGPATIEKYFNDSTGVFRRLPNDVAAVVNFGETAWANPPGDQGVSHLVFDGGGSSTIHATIINTRFVGATEEDRIDWSYWRGAGEGFEVKQIRFEPYYGIAFIAYDLLKSGSAQVTVGTPAYPALAYITRDVSRINANFDLTGSLICLRDFYSEGGPEFNYDEGFLDDLPPYLEESWPEGVSGTLKVLRWRELAAAQ